MTAQPQHEDITSSTFKWAVYEAATKKVLTSGEKIIRASDVEIKSTPKQSRKIFPLGDHFSFGLVFGHDRPRNSGFGLVGKRDDERTFSWEWFDIDRTGHAKKPQEGGELSFETKETATGLEIVRIEFLTDMDIRIMRKGLFNLFFPAAWRIKVFKGSVIYWPTCEEKAPNSV